MPGINTDSIGVMGRQRTMGYVNSLDVGHHGRYTGGARVMNNYGYHNINQPPHRVSPVTATYGAIGRNNPEALCQVHKKANGGHNGNVFNRGVDDPNRVSHLHTSTSVVERVKNRGLQPVSAFTGHTHDDSGTVPYTGENQKPMGMMELQKHEAQNFGYMKDQMQAFRLPLSELIPSGRGVRPL